MHPNGQLPAYEWAFGDVNPPVHAWAALRVYRIDQAMTGKPDRAFLERVFHKLMLNFTWWVNRKDAGDRNVFQGGFLGLDNIGIFDRSAKLPTGGTLDQADGTAWMATYSLNLMRIALELAVEDPVYEDIATKFFEHFLTIAEAMTHVGGTGTGLWDETDEFYYDVLRLPDGRQVPLRVRSLVGLIPLCAVEVLDENFSERFPAFARRARWILAHRPDLADQVSRWEQPGRGNRVLLSLLRRHRMKALLRRMLDETEFLSPHGVRSVSKAHAAAPFRFPWDGQTFAVDYEPAESTTAVFGGNSNWRGPVWLPINFLLVEALTEFGRFYGPTSRSSARRARAITSPCRRSPTSCPPASPAWFCAARRTPPGAGRQPAVPGRSAFSRPHPVPRILPRRYRRGPGAAHQTGWTGLLALLLQPRRDVAGGQVPAAPEG